MPLRRTGSRGAGLAVGGGGGGQTQEASAEAVLHDGVDVARCGAGAVYSRPASRHSC